MQHVSDLQLQTHVLPIDLHTV